MPRFLSFLALSLLICAPTRADDPPQTKRARKDPVAAALDKTKVKMESQGRLRELLASVREGAGLNVVCAPEVKLEDAVYTFRGPSEVKARLALQAALGSNGLRYDSFASCVYVSSLREPRRRPPELSVRGANKEALKRLSEVVPVTIEREELDEAFETLGDLLGLKVRAPNTKERARGFKAPDKAEELSLDVDALSGADILRLVSRQLQVAIAVRGDEVVVSSLKAAVRSDNTAAVAKSLSERPDFTLPSGTLAELGFFLEGKLKVRVFVDQEIAELPVTTPPADLTLSSMLYLAPGIHSGIDHRLLGEALVFERRRGRARPVDYVTRSEAGSMLRTALRSQKITVDFQEARLEDALAFIAKLVPKAELRCAEDVAERALSFRASDLRLKAVLLHVARLTDTRIVLKDKAIRLEAPK